MVKCVIDERFNKVFLVSCKFFRFLRVCCIVHPIAEKHLEKVLKNCEVFSDVHCKYYPCHFESQDCTWCCCPFYPCFDARTDVEFNENGWGCSKCHWIHKPHIAKEVLEELKLLGIKNPEELEAKRQKIMDIKDRVFSKNYAA